MLQYFCQLNSVQGMIASVSIHVDHTKTRFTSAPYLISTSTTVVAGLMLKVYGTIA